jgi:hypothetical protein
MTMKVLLDLELPRTLDAWVTQLLAAVPEPGTTTQAWLFEGAPARHAAEQRLAAAGIHTRFHSAYKPLVNHFLEEVKVEGLKRVTVRYPVHPKAPAQRFALEAYPLVEMVGNAEFRMEPQPTAGLMPRYEVELEWHDGTTRHDTVFAPNRVHVDPLGETLLSPTAWLRTTRNGVTTEGRHESEYEAVFRQAINTLQHHSWPDAEPYFERLDIRVDLPGIVHAPAEETGWINSHEALHEDLYFTLLEIFQKRSGRALGDRRLQPGQIVPDVRPGNRKVRLQIAVRDYPNTGAATEAIDDTPLAISTAPLSPSRITQEFAKFDGQRFEATSRQGRTVDGVYRPGTGPAVLISGGQHANETSGIVGALRAAHTLAQQPGAHFALIPLENPDGYALHHELCVQAPRHMHHAARYTALGDDLEYRDAPPYYEREARDAALRMSDAKLHVNLHGYPAHEWTRPLSGYIPRGFDLWTVPKGFFLIVRYHTGWAERARQLTEHVCRRLSALPSLMAFNKKQLASYNAHAGDLPFEVIFGTACTISEVNRPGAALTLITEFPDETIYGDPFIFAHDTQTATVLAAVEAMGLISSIE